MKKNTALRKTLAAVLTIFTAIGSTVPQLSSQVFAEGSTTSTESVEAVSGTSEEESAPASPAAATADTETVQDAAAQDETAPETTAAATPESTADAKQTEEAVSEAEQPAEETEEPASETEAPAEKTINVTYTVTDTDGNAIEDAEDGSFTFTGSAVLSEKAPELSGWTLEGAYWNSTRTDTLDADSLPDGTSEISIVFKYEKEENTETVYTSENSRIKATATLSDAQAVPAGAVFKVTEEDPEFAGGAYLEALNNAEGSDEESFTAENTLLYNIGFFVTEDGVEKEADLQDGTIKIEIEFKDNALSGIGAETGDDVDVIHLPLEDKSSYNTAEDAVDISSDEIDVESVDNLQVDVGKDVNDSLQFDLDNLSMVAFGIRKAPGNTKELVQYLTDDSYVRFTFKNETTGDLENTDYTKKDLKNNAEVNLDKNLHYLDSITFHLKAKYAETDEITTSDEYTYSLPQTGLTWQDTGSESSPIEMKADDDTVMGNFW